MGRIFAIGYEAIACVTFAYLSFFDGYVYTWWNWIVAIPVNIILSQIWPIYWLILRPVMGA